MLQCNEDLRAAIAELNSTHYSLMADSWAKLDEISHLRTWLARADESGSRALLSLVRGHLLSLPETLFSTTTPYSTTFFALRHQRQMTR